MQSAEVVPVVRTASVTRALPADAGVRERL